MKKCFVCNKDHDFENCPHKEKVKELVIARLKKLPDNISISIG